MIRGTAGLVLIFSSALSAWAAEAPKPQADTKPAAGRETPAERDRRMAWWREARFGLFVHWGPVSIKGTEISWSRGNGRGKIPPEVYDNLYKEFNPTKFNARQWAEIAKAAGMKYIVFTAKHHDGFCEFDSKLTDYKITNSPFGRDVCKELADACRQADIRLGFYYSPPDFHHGDFRKDRKRYNEYMHGQLRELCTNYGPVAVIWYDGLGAPAAAWDAGRMNALIRRLQPQVIINDRSGLAEDYSTPEGHLGKFSTTRDWEACLCIGHQWAWRPNDGIKSPEECIDLLASAAGANGNLLLNVGPMPTGEIEPRQVECLRAVGRWLEKYGQTIYGTRGGPYMPGTWGSCTYRGNTVYLHLLFSNDPLVKLPPLGKKIVKSEVLTGGAAEVKQDAAGVTIAIPVANRQKPFMIVKLELDGPAGEIPPVFTNTRRRK